MHNFLQRLGTLLLASMLFFTVKASDVVVDSVSYIIYNDSYAIVTGYYRGITHAKIAPRVIYKGREYNVTSISYRSFENNTTLKSVYIPGSIKKIGFNSFNGCSNLEVLTLNDGLEEIESKAFNNCSKLTSITLPATLKTLGEHCFSNCNSLKEVTCMAPEPPACYHQEFYSDDMEYHPWMLRVPTNLKTYESAQGWRNFPVIDLLPSSHQVYVGGLKYDLNDTTSTASVCGLKYDPDNSNVNIPESIISDGTKYEVTSISSHSFENNLSLKSVTIPGSIKTIRYAAFNGCACLETVNLHEGLTDIGVSCFRNCRSLKSIVIPKGVSTIRLYSFTGTGLERIIFLDDTAPSLYLDQIFGQNDLKKILFYVPDVYTYSSFKRAVDHIYNSYYANGLLFTVDKVKREAQLVANDYSGDFVVPEGFTYDDLDYKVTSLGDQCFYSCKELTSIKIPNTVKSLGSECFSSCYALKEINLPNSITTLNASCFNDCSALQSINIPQSVVFLGRACFGGCYSLKSISLPNSVTTIGDYCFRDCRELEKVTLPNALASLGVRCFYNCSNLTQIVIPSGVASLGNECFSNCIKLSSISMPSSVTSVGSSCFSGVGSVTDPCKLIIDDMFSSSLLKTYDSYYKFNLGDGCFVVPVQQLQLSSDDLSIVSYKPSTKITVKVIPSLANNRVLQVTSEDSSIVQIAANDSILPIRQGSTYINYQTTDGSKLSARLHVNVSFAPTEQISLKDDNIDLTVNKTYKPAFTVYPSGANQRTRMISSNENVVRIYGNDSIMTVSPGEADIRLEAFDDASKLVTLHVNVYDLTDSIKVDKAQETFYVGQIFQPSFMVYPSKASRKLKFSSSDEGIAKLDSNGHIIALSPGNAVIRFEAFDDSDVFDELHIRVAAHTQAISLDKSEIEVFEGLTYQPYVSILPSDAYQRVKIINPDENVVKVDSTGCIKAVGPGETDIRFEAYDNSNVFAILHVKVWPRTASITPSTKTMSLKVGEKYDQQTVEILPSDAYPKLKLTSEDKSVATVDDKGVITAVSPGVTNIVYQAGDSSRVEAKCRVIVYAADVVYVGGIYYKLTDETTTDDGRKIPAYATVTSIYGGENKGDDASKIAQFYSGTINIPKSVTYIGKTYPVTEVGSYSFYCQNKLQSIYIPSSVETVRANAAKLSTSLQLVTVEDNSQLVNIGSEAFEKCTGLLRFTFNGTTLKMKSIDPSAFSECTALQRVRWKGESTLTMIDDYAFYRCSSLNHMEMPNSVVRIGKHTFRYNTSLTDVKLAKRLSIIDEYAFGECGFSHITLPDSIASAQAGAFINNEHLKSITIPAGMEGIGAACFENNAVLDSVTFLTNIHTLTIGNNAFNLCPSLAHVNIAHLDSWAETNFNNAKANPANTAHHIYKDGKEVLDVVLPEGTQYVNNNAFNGCTYIKSVDMPSSIDHINDDIFVGCDSLKAVYCRAEEVPLFIGVNDPSAMNDVFNRATLYVPYGYEMDYKSNDWWGRFYQVKGFDASTGISGIRRYADDGVRFFDLNGRQIGHRPTAPGVYIKVAEGKRTKVTIK